ncbi:hypothetical protein ACFOZ0_25720 [Streptomyces yaanensis]|uniref:DivIVA domain-containing protein n=1 Tax=Streptomyces yaanensis TaxID=1142239 RepID=A0ABV7SIA0_9ACTN|nr:hypothetical protein [Streptomyces sp. CGMCC 4.7035]WNC01585.1 hypothetical protein Q2K21_27930 [Streptomyces sp. CGMCC 4.7035]
MTDLTPGGDAERREPTGARRFGMEEPREAPEAPTGPGERGQTAETRADRAERGEVAEPGPVGGRREARLLPREEYDKYELRLQHAVGDFVDEPRHAVEEVDQVVEEVATLVNEAVAARRRTLKAAWQTTGEEAHATADTEQLRLALRDYRATAERLLNM